MANQLADLLRQMREDGEFNKTAVAPSEPTAGDAQQNSDPLAMASDVTTRIGNFLQAGQGQVDPAGVTESTPQQGENQAGMSDGTGGTSRVQLEIPQGMTIKVASEIKTREEAVRFLLTTLPSAFAE